MINRKSAALLAVCLLAFQNSAFAENQMGYQLLPAAQASQMTRGGGTLGLDVGRAKQISDGGLTFELLRINSVRPNSPGDKAGFRTGDQIIAVDGKVFPTVQAFAGYVGSGAPGHEISVDYIPAGGGPQQAQRVAVVLGGPGATTQQTAPKAAAGLSTGTKIAIGVGAAALLGCYKAGCFTRSKAAPGL